MPLQTSGQISLANIATEFGDSAPHSLSEFYGSASGIPSSGQISIGDFYGVSDSLPDHLVVNNFNEIVPPDDKIILSTIYLWDTGGQSFDFFNNGNLLTQQGGEGYWFGGNSFDINVYQGFGLFELTIRLSDTSMDSILAKHPSDLALTNGSVENFHAYYRNVNPGDYGYTHFSINTIGDLPISAIRFVYYTGDNSESYIRLYSGGVWSGDGLVRDPVTGPITDQYIGDNYVKQTNDYGPIYLTNP
jgi:hypothetical protein